MTFMIHQMMNQFLEFTKFLITPQALTAKIRHKVTKAVLFYYRIFSRVVSDTAEQQLSILLFYEIINAHWILKCLFFLYVLV